MSGAGPRPPTTVSCLSQRRQFGKAPVRFAKAVERRPAVIERIRQPVNAPLCVGCVPSFAVR